MSSREVKDLCCRIKEDKCQCEGGKGTEVESGEALGMDEVHCLARGQPCKNLEIVEGGQTPSEDQRK